MPRASRRTASRYHGDPPSGGGAAIHLRPVARISIMRNIVANLSRQHRELTRLTMELVPLLDAARLTVDAHDVRRQLASIGGLLRVHVAMEDDAFYPSLLRHRDGELRTIARRFLVERDQIQGRWDAYHDRWRERPAIEGAAARFVDETRDMLLTLGKRMVEEDRSFHPDVLRRWEDRVE